MHDEAEAIKEIKALSRNARDHLSHVLRNGLMNILAYGGKKVTEEVFKVEQKIKEMGL